MSKAKYTNARRAAAMRKHHASKPTPEQVLLANIHTWLSITPNAETYKAIYQDMPEMFRECVKQRAKEFGYCEQHAERFTVAVMEVAKEMWAN